MNGLNMVELGNVSEETQGTMLLGISDSGGVHYYWFPHGAAHVRKPSEVAPETGYPAKRITRAQDSVR